MLEGKMCRGGMCVRVWQGAGILTVREMEVIWTGCCGDSLDTKLPGNAAVMLMRWILSKASI